LGCAGGREGSFCLPHGTLFRGVAELERRPLSSNSAYDTLDTDFIVGTAIRYFEGKGWKCIWRHISNKAFDELKCVQEQKPILQYENKAHIRQEYRLKRERHYWKQISNALVNEAERDIFLLLDKAMDSRG